MLTRRRLLGAALLAAAVALAPGHATAFPHVVRPGETLAGLAERTYGRVEAERLLVLANGLDLGGGIPIVPGMRLELPALGHRRVEQGDTWAGLAEELLGDASRSDVLATTNDAMPWLPPTEGQELIVPFNLRYLVSPSDTILSLGVRFLGSKEKAWLLDRYNHLDGEPPKPGAVLLIPLVELPLTEAGRAAAAAAVALTRSESSGLGRAAQRHADGELPLLLADMRAGRYVEAIARGNRVLGSGDLTRPQLALLHRQLTEAYAAFDAIGLAEGACSAWLSADPGAKLDPIELSPKVLRACTVAAATRARAQAEGAAADAGAAGAGRGAADAGRRPR